MKYELIRADLHIEQPVYKTEFIDEKEVSVIDTEKYSCLITLGLHPTDGIAPDFSTNIEVISLNDSTGWEVDEQRQKAVSDFMTLINQ